MRYFFTTLTVVALFVTGPHAHSREALAGIALSLQQPIAIPPDPDNYRVYGEAVRSQEPNHQQPTEPPRVYILDGPALVTLKERTQREPEKYRQSLDLLNNEAAAYLDTEPWTITKKTSLPPSGDKHDYESQGPYWWPNPDTKDGLPYIRRDGEKNPEIDKLTDHKHLFEMTRAVKTLALAAYLTGKKEYADKAAEFLRTWFINPSTHQPG